MIAELRKLVNALKNTKGAPEVKIILQISQNDELHKIEMKTKWFSNVEGIKFCGNLLKELTLLNEVEGKDFDEKFLSDYPTFFSMLDEENLAVFSASKTKMPTATKIKSIIIITNGKENKIDISDKVSKKASKLNPLAKKLMNSFGL